MASPYVLVDKAAMGGDYRLHLDQVGIEEVEILLRTHGFRQRGEIADVGEQDRHLALDLLAELDLADILDSKQIEELARHEAAVGGRNAVQPFAQGLGVVLCGASLWAW